jgi:hypothetical protein
MNRFLSSLMILALAGSLGAAANASSMHSKGAMNKARHGCTAGQTWVHGYLRGGKHVKGYCRAK